MPFETFQRQRVRPGADPLVTLQRRGVFSLNRAAFDALGQPEALELLYDREERLVGLRRASDDAPYAYPLRSLGRGATWLVSGTAFTNYYGIETPVSRRRVARLDGDLLIIDLKEPGTEVTSNRSLASEAH